jgi:F-box interacting protein
MAGDKTHEFATDILVDILLRLPPSSRRRARLVCRHWRGTVDDRTSEMRSRAVRTLISVKTSPTASGYVVDDLSGWRLRNRWTGSGGVHVVGTCNGLICLCDDAKHGGAVTLVNPVTGEGLVVPPLPRHRSSRRESWHEAYSFGYHPLTGRYKIVHVPGYLEPAAASDSIDEVQVFTLGEASWRSVPLPAAVRAIGCLGSGSVVSVDGTTYWLGMGGIDGKAAVSFDLGDERLYATPLPVKAKPGVTLTVVRGRLGVALDRDGRTVVWVLQEGRWRRRYILRLGGSQRLVSPQFAHGKYVLTAVTREKWKPWRKESVLYGHELGERRSFNVVLSKEPAVCNVEGYIHRTFAYVETREPLRVYETERLTTRSQDK